MFQVEEEFADLCVDRFEVEIETLVVPMKRQTKEVVRQKKRRSRTTLARSEQSSIGGFHLRDERIQYLSLGVLHFVIFIFPILN